MRPAPARDRLHAIVVALALCSTSVSIVVAGQPQDALPEGALPQGAASETARPAQQDGHGGESAESIRSFTDMIAEAAREQERLSAATPSQDCVTVVDAVVSGGAISGGAISGEAEGETHGAARPASAHRASGHPASAASDAEPAHRGTGAATCVEIGEPGVAAAL